MPGASFSSSSSSCSSILAGPHFQLLYFKSWCPPPPPSFLPPFLAGPHLPALDCSGLRWISTASSRSPRALPDLLCQLLITVGLAGLQPARVGALRASPDLNRRESERCGPRGTSTGESRSAPEHRIWITINKFWTVLILFFFHWFDWFWHYFLSISFRAKVNKKRLRKWVWTAPQNQYFHIFSLILVYIYIYTIFLLRANLNNVGSFFKAFHFLSFFKEHQSWVQSPCSQGLEVDLFQGSSFLPAMSMPSLVSRKWSKILYLGVNFVFNLVEETPGPTEAARIDIFPTKSSELNVQCVLGF